MKNKALIEAHISKLGGTVGCYDSTIEKLPKSAINELLENLIDCGSTDIVVKNRGKLYVIECSSCDDELDFTLYTQSQYLDEYGDEYMYKFDEYTG